MDFGLVVWFEFAYTSSNYLHFWVVNVAIGCVDAYTGIPTKDVTLVLYYDKMSRQHLNSHTAPGEIYSHSIGLLNNGCVPPFRKSKRQNSALATSRQVLGYWVSPLIFLLSFLDQSVNRRGL